MQSCIFRNAAMIVARVDGVGFAAVNVGQRLPRGTSLPRKSV